MIAAVGLCGVGSEDPNGNDDEDKAEMKTSTINMALRDCIFCRSSRWRKR